jgi:hypothetical protein
MRAAIEAALNRRIVELSHRFSSQEGRDRPVVDLAVVIVSATQVDEHILIAAVVADTLYKAAPVDARTIERSEAHITPVFHLDDFGAELCRSHADPGDDKGQARRAATSLPDPSGTVSGIAVGRFGFDVPEPTLTHVHRADISAGENADVGSLRFQAVVTAIRMGVIEL